MLRRTHVVPFTHVREGELTVEWLHDVDGRVVAFLERLLRLTTRLEGCSRGAVAEALRRQERRVRDARRLAGLAKTVLDLCTFRPDPGAARALDARRALFLARGTRWPPVPGDEHVPYAAAAATLDATDETGGEQLAIVETRAGSHADSVSASDVAAWLYADAPSATILERAPRMNGAALLDRYNLELARAVLLDAERLVLTARGGWRATFRAIKLARLMYRIERAGSTRRSYRVEVTGPAAPFMIRPQRYGIRMAHALPAFTRAPGWRIEAEVVLGDARAKYRLDGSAPLPKPRRGTRYDSAWEQSLARDFANKMRDERKGWSLAREDAPVMAGAELFLPDFTLRHTDGREALVELLGFWTPEYLGDKARKVAAAGIDNLVLVVFRGLAAGNDAAIADLERLAPIVWFKQRPLIGPVLEVAERVAKKP